MSISPEFPTGDNPDFLRWAQQAADEAMPSAHSLLVEATMGAELASRGFEARFNELGIKPGDRVFHDVPMSDGSLRVAVTPTEGVVIDGPRPVPYRVTVNEGTSIYLSSGATREQFRLIDYWLDPKNHRLSVYEDTVTYVIGYIENPPPTGRLPKIVRGAGSKYSLESRETYIPALPRLPRPRDSERRLAAIEAYSQGVNTLMGHLHDLHDGTRVEAAPNTETDGNQ